MRDPVETMAPATAQVVEDRLVPPHNGRQRVNSQRRSIIDLFAGVGGLSLGAARAGFNVVAAVDADPTALEVHALNFPNARHYEVSIEQLSGRDLLRDARLEVGELDGLVGGPPCQGFSEIGGRRTDDPRNALFNHFFRLVAEIRPKFFVVENVPGILASRYKEIREAAFGWLPKRYELCEPLLVKANDVGAPTSRRRAFFIGRDTEKTPKLRTLEIESLVAGQVTVKEALAGLPAIRSDWQEEFQSWRHVTETPANSFFARVTAKVPRGIGNEMAMRSYHDERLVSGCLGTRHTAATVRRFRCLGPGEVDPISKAIRLDPNGFCPTIRAGTGPDHGSFQAVRPIHPRSPRVITPREAARLQGFPDWFLLHPTKWHSFRHVGNSVSPIVSEAILHALALRLGSSNH